MAELSGSSQPIQKSASSFEPSHPAMSAPPGSMLLIILFFGSGFGALVFQVVWMRELSLLFGSTAQAAATTLSAFFLGLALGGHYWGKRSRQLQHPLRAYGLLELAVAASSLLLFALIPAYQNIHVILFDSNSAQRFPILATKFVIAIAALAPPAFFMGGTLPVVGTYLVRQREELASKVSVAYAINTLGAALGGYTAGFHLPQWVGYRGTYFVALGTTVLIGTIAVLAPKIVKAVGSSSISAKPCSVASNPKDGRILTGLAFLSGFNVLAMEVLWTRMFVQVLQNSVYTYSVIVVLFLVALSFGGFLARWLSRRKTHPTRILSRLLFVTCLLVAVSPYAFFSLTGNMSYFGEERSFGSYMVTLILTGIPVLAVPCLAMGTLFPYLLKVAESSSEHPGQIIGRLVAWNTVGAILGALFAGFVALSVFGLWKSILFHAVLYFVATFVVSILKGQVSPHRRVLVVSGLGLVLLFNLVPLPVIQLAPKQTLVECWEGNAATVSVFREDKHLSICVNNFYVLGDTKSAHLEERQAHLPLLLHPNPSRVYFLGMGTGITAGAALEHSVKEVTVCELLPEVIRASRKYFSKHVNGLFEDPRVRVVQDDGRNFLATTKGTFDLIIADLFLPWKSGTANLYSRENYQAAFERLASGGMYAQWVPLYQVSEHEFGVIARTMAGVFPRVTVWRGDFWGKRSIAMLLGHRDLNPLSLEAIKNNLHATYSKEEGKHHSFLVPGSGLPGTYPFTHLDLLMLYYCGDLNKAKPWLESFPLNVDDYPRIAFSAPLTLLRVESGEGRWLSGREWIRLCDQIQGYTRNTTEGGRLVGLAGRGNTNLLEAGQHLHASIIESADKDPKAASLHLERYHKVLRAYFGAKESDR